MNIRTTTSVAAVLVVLPHFFCCVLPITMSILGLGSSLGIFTFSAGHLSWFHQYQVISLVFSGAVLLVAALAQYIGWKMDCRQEYCSHGPCAPKKRWFFKLFIVSVALFAFNISIFAIH